MKLKVNTSVLAFGAYVAVGIISSLRDHPTFDGMTDKEKLQLVGAHAKLAVLKPICYFTDRLIKK